MSIHADTSSPPSRIRRRPASFEIQRENRRLLY
jgi:hypothetical protein